MKKIIIICGATGIGKTSVAIKAAQRFGGEIVGADSMQIYKHLDIGTAKPDKEELEAAKHHLVDFLDPATEFDAGMYVKQADAAIEDIMSRGKLPIVAGGTGLYIKALVNGLFRTRSIDRSAMERLTRELEEKGPKQLHARLKSCDPVSADRIHPNDSFRVIRALELYESSGVPMSRHQKEHHFGQVRYDTLKLGLLMQRDVLYERINLRVDMMVNAGLLDEVNRLVEQGYSLDLKPMQSIGYRHMGMFLKGEVGWEEAIRLLKRDTRRYAKRQFTWFNQDKEIHWVEPGRFDSISLLVKEFLT